MVSGQAPGNHRIQFRLFFPELVRYKKVEHSEYSADFGNDPLDFDWDSKNGAGYDYFIVRSENDARAALSKDRQDAVVLEASDGKWWLYRRAE